MLGAVTAPAIAVAATASPAVPSLTPTSAAMAGSTLAGRNSLATSAPIPAASAARGTAAGREAGAFAWSEEEEGGEDDDVRMRTSVAVPAPQRLIV
ncbi:hypothetical protein GCM10009550_32420 [Actinocorallia libanotica]|uniref:Secreted protein n=1 Tax=Actinocorallia libanotica TaxID=46162 RepID=A0ABN1R5Z0_9ACTN